MRKIYSVLALGLFILIMVSPITAMAAPTRRDVVIGFLVTCIDGSGGGIAHPSASPPTQSSTFDIFNVLDLVEGLIDADLLLPDRVLQENITSWVQSLQNITPSTNNPGYGGFGEHTSPRRPMLSATFYAIQTLERLNTTTSINYDTTLNYTARQQRVNATEYPDTVGGFVNTPDDIATVASTYHALEILLIFNEISRINSSLAISWLNSCQLLDPALPGYGGFVNGRNTTITDLQSTYMAIQSLEILNALNTINQTAAILYIIPHYNANPNYPQQYGGFGNTPEDTVSTQLATFYSVATIQILGAGNQLSLEEITTWILNTQTPDGGFADPTLLTGFTAQTNLAVSTLAQLDQLIRLLEPVGPDLFVFPWWIVGIIVVIIILILCFIAARRMEWF